MTPRGAAPLIEMRLAGQCPAGEVWITVGEGRDPDWWKWSNTLAMPELLVRPEDPIDHLDFRCVHGLNVILFSETWDDRAARAHDRLVEYVHELCVMCPEFGFDIGWRWIKGIGRVEFGEAHFIEELKNAQAEATHFAVKGDKVAYKAAQSNERRIREAAPWLR
ncbi:MAG: hypothetical protein HY847_12400 [Betaproteobacteria bacterium]|nr:hypothetical protein [Betaproteobacteria bacterium]